MPEKVEPEQAGKNILPWHNTSNCVTTTDFRNWVGYIVFELATGWGFPISEALDRLVEAAQKDFLKLLYEFCNVPGDVQHAMVQGQFSYTEETELEDDLTDDDFGYVTLHQRIELRPAENEGDLCDLMWSSTVDGDDLDQAWLSILRVPNVWLKARKIIKEMIKQVDQFWLGYWDGKKELKERRVEDASY